jgi:hypothetical protein
MIKMITKTQHCKTKLLLHGDVYHRNTVIIKLRLYYFPLWRECFPLVSNYRQVFLTWVKSISQNVDILITATTHIATNWRTFCGMYSA